jgi:hypothetical protein
LEAYSGTNWNLKVSTTAIDPETESGNIFDGAINTKPYTITGLNAQTTYYWYVQTICGTETSNWSAQASFTTSCAPISSFPFIESFDGTTFAPTSGPTKKLLVQEQVYGIDKQTGLTNMYSS